MNAFISFLSNHLLSTAAALVSIVAGVIAIINAIKKDKRILRIAWKVSLLFLVIALAILAVQYCTTPGSSSNTPPAESTYPATSDSPAPSAPEPSDPGPSDNNQLESPAPASPSEDGLVQGSENDDKTVSAAEDSNTTVQKAGDITSGKDSVIAQSSGDNGKTAVITGDDNTVSSEEGNTNFNEVSVTTQNSGNSSNVATVTGSGNTVIQGENNMVITGNNNTITPPNTEIPVTVSNVVLDKEQVNLTVDESLTLTATVLYSNNEKDSDVIWASSDTTIANVDEAGNVTAVSPGTARIIAQAAKNNSTETAECEINVIAAPSGYSISLSTDTATLYSPFRIYITPYEENAARIQVHAKAPSGHVDNFVWDEDKSYHIETETGLWTVWATIENEAGTYEGSKESDFATIEITPLSFENLFPDPVIP